MTRRLPKVGLSGPDMRDAASAIESLMRDWGLHFRSTMVYRNSRFLARAYAHEGPCLADSKTIYQTYKEYDASGGPLVASVMYFLALDLYWQAEMDITRAPANDEGLLELP